MEAHQMLGVATLHLWHVDPEGLTDEEVAGLGARFLSVEEKRQRLRFCMEEDGRRYAVTRALVRRVLSRYADVDPRDWEFAANEHGRPMVVQPAGAAHLHFSISHTRGHIACLVGVREEIGVDVEGLGRRIEPLAIARRYFAPSEAKLLEGLPEADRRRRFFQLWTLKEAYGKALGRGLAVALDRLIVLPTAAEGRFTFSFNPPSADSADAWYLQSWQPTDQHVLAIAVRCGRGQNCEVLWEDAISIVREE
jgi:4'-phosphopantetheinyl transferase